MNFERDVFISYAHIDNLPLTPGQEGWVNLFHYALQTILTNLLGKKANIWKDDKGLRGNDDLWTEISDQLPKSAALVSVLTPRYLQSASCTQEIREFCQAAGTTGGLFVNNKGRVFKVFKTPLARSDTDRALPPEVGKATGYEFFDESKYPTAPDFDPAYGGDRGKDLLRTIWSLADDIKGLLQQLGDVAEHEVPAVEDERKPRIYLAKCVTSRKCDREKLLSDLKFHRYAVFPEEELPEDEAGYGAAVERVLAQCQLSIHLIGSSYGTVPEGDSQKSTVVLQNEIAAKLSHKDGLRRVISLPEGTCSPNPTQQAVIDGLLKNSEMQFGADLVTGDLETLMETIHQVLERIEQPKELQPPRPGDHQLSRKTVHVLYDERDDKDVIPLLKYLVAQGCEVTSPIFTGEDAGKVRGANQALYMGCDAVILFYGAGDQSWKYYQQSDLKKMRAQRGDKPLLGEFTYVAAPTTRDKELVVSLGQEKVINALNGFSEEGMAPFIKAVASSGGIG